MGFFPTINEGELASTYGKIYGGIYSWTIRDYINVIRSKCSTEKAIYEKKYEDSLVLVAYFYLRIKDMQQDHNDLILMEEYDNDYKLTQENFNQMLDNIFWERLISLCGNDKVLALEIFNDVQEKYLERGREYIISKYIDFKNRENKEDENIRTIKIDDILQKTPSREKINKVINNLLAKVSDKGRKIIIYMGETGEYNRNTIKIIMSCNDYAEFEKLEKLSICQINEANKIKIGSSLVMPFTLTPIGNIVYYYLTDKNPISRINSEAQNPKEVYKKIAEFGEIPPIKTISENLLDILAKRKNHG